MHYIKKVVKISARILEFGDFSYGRVTTGMEAKGKEEEKKSSIR